MNFADIDGVISDMDGVLMNFADIDGVISDMDGVLWRGDQPLPGVGQFFDTLRQRGIPYMLATNNSTKSPLDYVAKLERMGVTGILPAEILTSGLVTVDYLKTHVSTGTPIYVIGAEPLKRMIEAAGFPVGDEAGIVVVGLDVHVTYDKLRHASLLIRRGAMFIGTNDDASIPSPDGLIPGCGSLLAALHTATGRAPKVMGKPDAPMFEAAMRHIGSSPSRTLMIGDRLNTDIAGAQRLGLRTALVLTGVTTPDDVATAGIVPDAIYAGLPDLLPALSDASI